ncbi:MAG TPA: hypothetical protein VFZ56_13615 [Gemmatimonadaceae bacterium]
MRPHLYSVALFAVTVSMACTDLPTAAPTVTAAPTSARFTSFSNAGALEFTSDSDCALQSGTVVCNFTATGLADGEAVSMHYWVTWSIPMQCVHQKTGKLASARKQPTSPWVATVDGGASGYGWEFSGGQLTKSDWILYPPSGFSSEAFCGKGPYRLEMGATSATYWMVELTYDADVWARMWDYPT